MAIILDKYAIKEVADVMFYELDSKGAPSAPVLYLDTLKTSTLEQSSETVDATGGKGNVKLLSWDTNKELTLTLEDALFSAKSLGIMFGGTMQWYGEKQEVLKTLPYDKTKISETHATGSSANDYITFEINGQKLYIKKTLVTAFSYQDAAGKEKVDPVAIPADSVDWTDGVGANGQEVEFITFDLLDCTSSAVARQPYVPAAQEGDADTPNNGVISGGLTIDIGAEFNSNTYYITGDTYARNFQSGKDEFLQFIVPKGKVSAEDVSLTMEADGDPATFSMSVKCLKANDGSMLKLVKYNLEAGGTDSIGNKGVASVLDAYESNHDDWTTPNAAITANTSQNVPDYVPGED